MSYPENSSFQEKFDSPMNIVFKLLCEHKCSKSIFSIIIEAYSEPSQAHEMELFMKIANDFSRLTNFIKSSVSDIWLGSEYDPEFPILISKVLLVNQHVRFQFQSSNFNVGTDGLHTRPISIKANYSKHIYNCLKTVLKLNSSFHWKIVFSLS